MRKRLDIQEALKRPIKQKRKLRIFISNTFNPAKSDAEDGEGTVASWELRVEGRLLEDSALSKYDATKQKRKFSSFFKSLVIELDKDLYGPDNHLVEWHRTATTQETDGFQVKRPGDVNVRCTVLLMLDYQPPQFKLDPRLARLLGIHTQTRPVIIQALWQYIKTHKLQDPHEREFVICDKYLQQIFESQRMKFSEIPQRLHALLMPPEPIIINHVISVDPNDQKKTACYDIDVEVDDTLKTQMNSFLLSTASQQEIATLDNKIHETIETINQLKTQREFMLSFARDPQGFINDWLQSQCRDLKTMTDVVGNPEEERRAEFYFQPWAQEAVCRYFYSKDCDSPAPALKSFRPLRGSAIAKIVGGNAAQLARFDPRVTMWVFEEDVGGRKLTEVINTQHENVKYLPGHKLPPNVVAVPDVVQAAVDADILIFVVPHQFIGKICDQLKGHLKADTIGISLIKGVDEGPNGLKLISEVIGERLGIPMSVLMGANIASEVADEKFCETTIGCKDLAQGQLLKELMQTPNFRITVVQEVDTVEICGALKNIVAVGAGFCDGLGFGDNTKAAVIRLGLMEMIAFTKLFCSGPVSSATFLESCGVADLITTCYGGRNRKVAEAFARTGKSIEQLEKEMLNGQKLQGPQTARELHSILQHKGLLDKFPLFMAVYKVCYENQPVGEFIRCLQNHPEHM
ncbi:SWI/SNF-related matrix-associated actin-dependent regulator of chromatin subfamily D member 1 [Pontoporia blainvillei]|uniref:Glycerol-3-phosphate dehydrogenase [NAD(+)] n=1 Tax=Pontoporia blainvillei TaxID=48723 RepID=A0ABX0RYS0_PONBL|nr:SWI/SNF-related matrix-associated actin-dependent regulator of chromatin subfamily D member 1 [Pontoporia blainvillei]